MSWLSDGLDWIGGQFGSSSNWGSDAGDFLTRNFGSSYQTPGTFPDGKSGGSSWDLGKILDGGRKLYNLWDSNSARQDSRNQLLDVYAKIEADNNAYNQQMAQYNAQRAGAAAAARRANDAKARKAQAKALKVQEKFLNQMIANYQPYADAAKTLTPEMAKNYKQFLDTTSLFNQYLTPTVAKTLGSAPTPMAAPQVNPQAYTAPSQAPQVSFPTLEEMLKRGK